MDLYPTPWCKKMVISACVLFILLAALSVTGCAKYYRHSYSVNVTGLDQFVGNGTTRILVPVPVMNDQPAFSTGADPVWNVSFVNTSHGPMIQFSSNESNLSNVTAVFSSSNGYQPINYGHEGSYTSGVLLSPSSTVPKEYQSGSLIGGEKYSLYSSYVWLDENLSPRNDSGSEAISIDLRFDGSVIDAQQGEIAARHITVQETVAPGMTGTIPVIVKVTD